MTSPENVLILFVVVVGIALILRVQQKKEIANQIAAKFCRQNELQLLDGTVAFRGWHIIKSTRSVAYRFKFEYSDNRVDRHGGTISLVGDYVQNIFVDEAHLAAR